jgi:hypothetical protein
MIHPANFPSDGRADEFYQKVEKNICGADEHSIPEFVFRKG